MTDKKKISWKNRRKKIRRFLSEYLTYTQNPLRVFLILSLPFGATTLCVTLCMSANWSGWDTAFFSTGICLAMASITVGGTMRYFAKNVFDKDQYNVFGELLVNLNEGYSFAHGLRKAKTPKTEHFDKAFTELFTALKSHFEYKTDSTCSMAIITFENYKMNHEQSDEKIVGESDNNKIDREAILFEFYRDKETENKRII